MKYTMILIYIHNFVTWFEKNEMFDWLETESMNTIWIFFYIKIKWMDMNETWKQRQKLELQNLSKCHSLCVMLFWIIVWFYIKTIERTVAVKQKKHGFVLKCVAIATFVFLQFFSQHMFQHIWLHRTKPPKIMTYHIKCGLYLCQSNTFRIWNGIKIYHQCVEKCIEVNTCRNILKLSIYAMY